MDKKTRGDRLRFVVLAGVGRPALLEGPDAGAAAGGLRGGQRMTRVLVLNGPNLARLGSREPDVYGAHVVRRPGRRSAPARARRSASRSRCARPTTRPSWSRWLHEAADGRIPVVLNPAAFTHYSYALRDACAQRTAPLVEVHLSNPAAREEFRHTSVVAGVATGTIAGFGLQSYAWPCAPSPPTW